MSFLYATHRVGKEASMPNIYAQSTKIHNVVGRSEYLTDDVKMNVNSGRSEYISGQSGRQEEVVLHIKDMTHDWKFYASYERSHEHNPGQKQNEARELIIALPNELAGKEKGTTTIAQKEILRNICTDLADEIIGPDHDREIAVHWNHSRTNLHVHILYSERAIVRDPQIRQYKKDIWIDSATGRLAKVGSEGAVLVHRKGDPMLNEDGSYKYSSDPLTPKDIRFKQHSFMWLRNKAIQKVMDSYGYHLDIQDRSTPFLSQRKYFKGASADYLKNAHEYNAEVRKYNAQVREHLSLEPEKKPEYIEIRGDIERTVRKENSKEKKISSGAIQAVREMAEVIKGFVAKARASIKTTVESWWKENKTIFLSAFRNQAAGSSEGGNEVNDGRRKVAGRATDTPQPAGCNHSRATKTNIRPTVRDAGERLSALRGATYSRRPESSVAGSERAVEREPEITSATQRM